MDGEMHKSRIKSSTHKASDIEAQNKLIINLRAQSSSRQPAQERLKRLQTNLKLNSRKADRERPAPKRSSRHSSQISLSSAANPAASATSQTCVTPETETSKQAKDFLASLKNVCLPERPKPVQPAARPQPSSSAGRSILASCKRSSTAHIVAKSAWAKPKALLDASNRLETNRSNSVNQRLARLREALQEQQQQQKETNNNYNEATTITTTTTTTTTLPNKKLTATSAIRSLKAGRLSADAQSNDDVEPMDVDWQEEQEEAPAATDSSSISGGTVINLNKSQSKLQTDDKSDQILQRLLTTEQDLPARRVDHMYFVLDTNVLMDNLVFVEDLCHVALGETNGSMLYIPYIVIKELDKLKDTRNDNNLKRTAAVRAIRYLNDKFDNSLQIQGQSALEEAEHLIEVDCPDDSIVNCCLQLQAQVPHLMLLTNDNNLRLKANASAIQVSCRSDLLNDYRTEFDALPT